MIALIDYGMGNLGSVTKAFATVGAAVTRVTTADEMTDARALVLPGVGAFPAAMKNLSQRGFVNAIRREVSRGKPILGICLGYQLLFDRSSEMEPCEGLGLIGGDVVKFTIDLKIPHMGWNSVTVSKKDPVAEGIVDSDYFYFVHSFYPELKNPSDALFETEYGIKFVSAIARANVYGVQFHPEKSQEKGLVLLKNFVEKVCSRTP
ncbi:MAG: imidazole glycerol phosphate synthase subunit HisH [Spirochaetes bacterium]|nr:imidazole glycerol phosphate synthase subunit HisH [Spirochaetota bacterium]